jgi:hypothetical protein
MGTDQFRPWAIVACWSSATRARVRAASSLSSRASSAGFDNGHPRQCGRGIDEIAQRQSQGRELAQQRQAGLLLVASSTRSPTMASASTPPKAGSAATSNCRTRPSGSSVPTSPAVAPRSSAAGGESYPGRSSARRPAPTPTPQACVKRSAASAPRRDWSRSTMAPKARSLGRRLASRRTGSGTRTPPSTCSTGPTSTT